MRITTPKYREASIWRGGTWRRGTWRCSTTTRVITWAITLVITWATAIIAQRTEPVIPVPVVGGLHLDLVVVLVAGAAHNVVAAHHEDKDEEKGHEGHQIAAHLKHERMGGGSLARFCCG
jgi:hypothetical protein